MKRCLLWVAALLLTSSVWAQTAKPGRPYVDFTVLTDAPKGFYAVGHPAEVRVVAKAGGNALDGVTIHYEMGDDRMEPSMRGAGRFSRGEARVQIPAMESPGFRYCTIRFEVEGESYTETVKVGFGAHEIKPTIPNPLDFSIFWRQTIKQARKTPLEVERTPLPEYSTEEFEVQMVRIPIFEDGSCMYGYLTLPRDGKPHPVLFVPPGAGVKRIRPTQRYAKAGFITLEVEIHGMPVNATDDFIAAKKEELGEYWYTNIEQVNEYYYKKVYAGCVRSIDFLMTLPEWDGEHVGVTGGSQGGALSIVTAALHEEVDFLASFYPALCDVSGYQHGRAGGWPRMFATIDARPDLNHKRALKTMAYYDVVNFARRVKVPGFYSYGFNDNTCPPTSVAAALNVIEAPKQIVTTPASYHWRYEETHREAVAWMQEQCK